VLLYFTFLLIFKTRKNMKQLFYSKLVMLLLFVAAFFATPQTAQATHAVGADLTYTYLGNNTYRFTMAFYRDCAGIAAPTSFTASVNGCGNNTQTFTLLPVGTGVDITPTCASATSTCAGGSVFGVQRYEYSGTFTFSSVCEEWVVSTQECCRNTAITTIAGANSFDLYVEAVVNNTVANNSPAFTQIPALYACAGQPFIYNNVVIDVDGDSLVYALTNPLDGPAPGTSISYSTGFNALKPLSVTAAGFGFNNNTGQFSFTPTTIGQVSVLALLVKEYRNGVLIGSVLRDVQIIVINCAANNAPVLSGITNVTGATFVAANNSGTFKVCPGQVMKFDINASDLDATQTLDILTNAATSFPGAITTITPTTGNGKKLSFTWVPSNNDAGSHLFRVETRDDHCPTYGSAVKGFVIIVQGVQSSTTTRTVCLGTPTTVSLSAQATEVAGGQYQWTASPSVGILANTQNITTNVSQTTTFTVKYLDNVCNATDTIIIRAYGGVSVTPVVVNNYCPTAAPVQLEANYANPAPGGPGVSYSWVVSPAANGAVSNPSIFNPTATATAAANGSTMRYIVTANDGRCISKDTAVINVNCPNCFNVATVTAGISPVLTCTRTSVALTAASQGSNGALTYRWSNNATASTINVSVAGTYTATVTNTQTGGASCTSSASIVVTQNLVSPVVTASSSNNLTCFANTATLSATSNIPSTFAWSGGSPNNPITVTAAGTYTVTATNLVNGCSATANVVVTQNTVAPTANITSTGGFTCIVNTATLTASSSVPTTSFFTWSNGQNVPVITVNTIGTYTVTVTNDLNGCSTSRSITVGQNITPPVVTITTPLGLTCARTSTLVTATSTSAISNFIWSNGGTTPAITVSVAGIYTVTATQAANGCTSTRSITVTQNAVIPAVSIAVSNQLTCVQTSAVLTASSSLTGNTFLWSTGALTPTITATSIGTYGVTVTNTLTGCVGSSLIAVTQNITPTAADVSKSNDLTCAQTTSILVATGAIFVNNTYLWSNNVVSRDQIVSQPGIYTVTITNPANGCTASSSVAVTRNGTVPNVAITGVTAFCDGKSTVLTAATANGASDFIWNNNTAAAATTVNTAGNYTVTATNVLSQCTATRQIAVTVRPAPFANITQPTIFCEGFPTALAATGGGAYLWSSGASTQGIAIPITVTAGTSYTVTVTGTNGCSATSSKVVEFLPTAVCVGTESTTNIGDITLFPNPSTQYFNLVFGTQQWLDATITVTDIAGKTIFVQQKPFIAANESVNIETVNWAAGMYFVKITNASQKAVLKVVKQ
jgi:Secretion system C-terminal sorting domain